MLMLHTVAAQGPALQDRLTVARGITANGAGGAGATVTAAVVFAEPMPDANYHTDADAGQDVVIFVTSKTTLGFTLNISPRLAANNVAAGNVNWIAIE